MRPAALALFLVLFLGSREAGHPPGFVRDGGPSVQDTLVGTVRSVDAQLRTLEVLVGVGPASRVSRVRISRAVPVLVQGTSARLEDLQPGQVVRVAHRTTVEGRAAASIEVVSPERGAR